MDEGNVRRRAHVKMVAASKPGLDRRSGRRVVRIDGPLLTKATIEVFLKAWDATHDLDQAAAVADVSPGKRYWLSVLLRVERGVG